MAHLFRRLKIPNLGKVPVRHSRGPNHWMEKKKRRNAQERALQHFDDFYSSVYGNTWNNIRTALLMEGHKYMAVVNNFSDAEKTESFLKQNGAVNIRTLYNISKERLEAKDKRRSEGKWQTESPKSMTDNVSAVISRAQSSKISSLYPDQDIPQLQSVKDHSTPSPTAEDIESATLKSIDPELNEVLTDNSRIVKANVDVSTLYHFIPATQIKGANDFVLESEYYQHYKKGEDFSVETMREAELKFPKTLNGYTFAADDHTKFPSPKLGSTNVLDYYLFDGASILPVLAMDIQPGDIVLDMCAAPGGKSLAIIQTLAPQYIILNDITESRLNRIRNVLQQFVKGFENVGAKIILTQQDARRIDDADVYDKILVDVPCTTDRHSLHSSENNIFKTSRVKERLKIPEIQTEILMNALKLIKVGGTVVYSTCTLSPIQNEGVVQLALKRIWEEEKKRMAVSDMSAALRPLYLIFKFAEYGLKYGHIAVPTVHNNWGPLYFCKITRLT